MTEIMLQPPEKEVIPFGWFVKDLV